MSKPFSRLGYIHKTDGTIEPCLRPIERPKHEKPPAMKPKNYFTLLKENEQFFQDREASA